MLACQCEIAPLVHRYTGIDSTHPLLSSGCSSERLIYCITDAPHFSSVSSTLPLSSEVVVDCDATQLVRQRSEAINSAKIRIPKEIYLVVDRYSRIKKEIDQGPY